MLAAIVLLLLVLLLLLLRQNIILILAAAVAYMHLAWGDGDILFLIEDAWLAIDKEALLSIPMFILCGAVMTRGSIAQRLIDIMVVLTRSLKSGMAVATILSCAVFAAVSGSSPVTLLAVGAVLYPALLQQRYPKQFALGALTAGGTLGIIVPPSIPLILYGIVTETSIVDLFIAGVIPALMLTAVMTGYAVWRNRHHHSAPDPALQFKPVLMRGAPALFMPILLLGGIYSGYFSPTESAVVALFYAILIELFFYRQLNRKKTFEIVQDTITLLGSIIPIIAIATSINLFLATEGIPHAIANWMQANLDNVFLFLLCLNILLLLVGMVMDTFSSLLILGPMLATIAMQYGIHPVHLGVIMVLNLEIGLLTPPLGINLLVASKAFKEPFYDVVKSVLPFIGLMLAVLLLVSFFPIFTLGLLD